MSVTVILPTYNPHIGRLNKTLEGLKGQRLACKDWELIIVDNNSSNNFHDKISLKWHPNAKIITEKRLGLTFARLKGITEAKGEFLVMVDDDNVLGENYLANSYNILDENYQLGAIGGKSLPVFESAPPEWLAPFYGNLALRDLGEEPVIEQWNHTYPKYAPIGAGMVIRKKALASYIEKITSSTSIITDRTATLLSSGGDNDIILEILRSGWMVGYFPDLQLEHLIPQGRTQPEYLARLLNNTNKSWIELLRSHNINPWNLISPWSIPCRKIKAYFTYKAWAGKVQYIMWRGACGTFDGLNKTL